MDLRGKKVGIWGYGIVGKAACSYLKTLPCSISVCDKRALSHQEFNILKQSGISVYLQNNLDAFLLDSDYIIPSPGIDLSPYASYAHKWLCELDLFATNWDKPIIAVTGTAGKTTVTHILSLLFKNLEIPIALGGNIGIGMLSLLNQKKTSDYALLELSSWQLQDTKLFTPHITIWTNFSPNHLDRHKTMQHYFNAKYQSIARQKKNNYTIVPLELMKKIYAKKPDSCCTFFSEKMPSDDIHLQLREQDRFVYYHKKCIYKQTKKETICITKNIVLPDYTFAQNWIAIIALLDLMELSIKVINKISQSSNMLEHRLEYVGIYNGARVYNDSKATTPASTIASIKKFKNKRIHLFLGGLSKGINRKPLITFLRKKDVIVYCFGDEHKQLHALCLQKSIQSHANRTLENVINICKKNCQQGEIILFSPAGSSFDLFKNYQDRGNMFKNLIMNENC